MPEEEPVCDCEEGEPPDPDPGCCGADTCEENETCCNETTCVLTSTFQTDSNNCGDCGTVCSAGETCVAGVCTGGEDTCPPGYVSCGATGGTFIIDSDVEWTWVNNDGCPEGCVAFKAEQPTAEEEAAGVAPGDFSYDGICCYQEGCCTAWHCVPGSPYQFVAQTPYESSEADCIMEITEFMGDPLMPCNSTPRNMNNIYNTWVAGSCSGGLSVPSDGPVEVMERPCYQEECETHVATWMAEPSGEPNEEGLCKVKWILLDDCPGACCSDQPTQPEFVKKSELVDALCKCGGS